MPVRHIEVTRLLLTSFVPVNPDDDFAVSVVAKAMGQPENVTSFLFNRSQNAPFTLYNNETGFMEARNANGSFAGPDNGWTEGSC